jgi:PKD repeat protein
MSGEAVSFSGTRSSGGGVGCAINSWSWNFGDGITATGSNPSHAFTSASGSKTYTNWLTVTDCNSKISSNSVLIRVTGLALGNSQQQQAFSDDPVNLATGNYIYDHVDLRLPGAGLAL